MIPFITITLDKPRRLRFGMEAMVEFEQTTNIKLAELDNEMSVSTTARLLWIMLKEEDKSLTFEETLKLVDNHAKNVMDVKNTVSKAILISFGLEEQSDPNA